MAAAEDTGPGTHVSVTKLPQAESARPACPCQQQGVAANRRIFHRYLISSASSDKIHQVACPTDWCTKPPLLSAR